jgi:hypothetical protein
MTNTNAAVPNISSVNIFSLFTDYGTFKVPSYQRQYAWGEEETEALFDDFLEFHKELETTGGQSYILGQAIFAPNHDTDKANHSLAIVDGQQRLTTLYLFAIALKKWLGLYGISGMGGTEDDAVYRALHSLLFASNPMNGSENKRLKVAYGGEDSVDELLEGNRVAEFVENDTQKNISQNYVFLEEKIRSAFQDGPELAAFARTILYKVWVIATKIVSESQALEIFEKINSRGKALNSAELLKNLLFRNALEEDFKAISDQWNIAADAMFKVRPTRAAGMQFLMKSLLGAKQGQGTSNRLVFQEWRKELSENEIDPTDFATNLATRAKYVSGIATASRNEKNKELFACRRFNTVQHLPVVIATQALSANSDLQQAFFRFLDTRFLISILAKEQPQTLERMIWPWAKNLAALDANSTLADLRNACAPASEGLGLLLEQAKLSFMNLDYSKPSNAKQIKYVLACASLHVEVDSGDGLMLDVDSFFTAKTFDLDHIFPRSLAEAADFDLSQGKDWIHNPGNIALLHSGDNRSQGATRPADKVLNFGASRLLLTATLAPNGNIAGANDRKMGYLEKLRGSGFQPVDSNWHAEQARDRASAYWTIFEEYVAGRLNFN